VDGERLLERHVQAHWHIVDALDVRVGGHSAVSGCAGSPDGNNIHRAVGTVVVDHLFHNDESIFAHRDLGRPFYPLVDDLQVGRTPGRAKHAGHNGDYP
jgi:hypothetical protein